MKENALVSLVDYPLISNITATHHDCQVDTLNNKGKVNTKGGNEAYVHVTNDVVHLASAIKLQPVAVALDASH
jgi:hypothetical protein